jgi:hypothetical protein
MPPATTSASHTPEANPAGRPSPVGLDLSAMSKRTTKARLRARRKKANHGQKPNRGRGHA